MTTLELDRFACIDSPVRRWDPRWKLVAGAIFAGAVAFVHQPAAAMAALVVAVGLAATARLPARGVLQRLRAVGLIIAAFVVVLALTGQGERVAVFGLPLSRSGLRTGVLMGLRALAIVLSLLVVTSTAPTQQTFAALRALRVPESLVQVLHLSYRYLFLMQAESRSIRTAMRARGHVFRFNGRTFAVLGNVIGMLLIRSMERADRVYLAMTARGFDGRFRPREQWHSCPADAVKSAVLVAMAAGIVLLDRMWLSAM